MKKLISYNNEELTETELYKKLIILTKNQAEWEQNIKNIHLLLKSDSAKIQAKSL